MKTQGMNERHLNQNRNDFLARRFGKISKRKVNLLLPDTLSIKSRRKSPPGRSRSPGANIGNSVNQSMVVAPRIRILLIK